MLKDLVRLANRLDELGLRKEADFLDSVIKKHSGHHADSHRRCDKCGRLYHEMYRKDVFDQETGRTMDICPTCSGVDKKTYKYLNNNERFLILDSIDS